MTSGIVCILKNTTIAQSVPIWCGIVSHTVLESTKGILLSESVESVRKIGIAVSQHTTCHVLVGKDIVGSKCQVNFLVEVAGGEPSRNQHSSSYIYINLFHILF